MKALLLKFSTEFKIFCLLFTGIATSLSGFAQIATNYTFSQTSGTFTPISGGTLIIDGMSSTSLDSWTSPAITIPAVSVNGTVYTTAYMTSNGLVKLGGTAPSITLYTGISTTPADGGVHLCPFSADLNKATSTAASEMRWEDVGTELVFQWKGWCRYNQTENFDLQVRINKNNGIIKFVYNLNSGPGAGTAYQPQVGIASASTAGNYLNRLVGTTSGQNWANSVVGTANSSTCRFTGATTDPRSFVSGQHYIFTPTACTMPNPGNTIASATSNMCAGNVVNFSLTNSTSGEVVTYQWQTSNDNVSYSDIAGSNLSTAALSVSNQYYRCRVICKATNDTVYSTPVQLNYTNSVLTSTGAQRCGAGSLDLSATANTGATISWYDAAIGGTLVGTGNTLSTPTIANTTNFFAQAATTSAGNITIGTGTTSASATSYPNPLSAYHGGSKHQMLFLASELSSQGLVAGNITAISFDVTHFNASGILNDFTIRLGHTSSTALSGFVTGTNTTYNASYTPNTTGVVTFTFTTPFYWDGSQNLIVETVHNQGNGGNGNGTRVAYTSTTFNSVYARSIDNVTPAGVASFDATTSTSGSTITSMNRPNIRFNGQLGCISPRVSVSAIINTAPLFTITDNKTVCNNGITPLSVTSTQSSYNQVTWSPITNLFTDAAATIPYVANTHAYTVYHKSAIVGSVEYIATGLNTTTMCGGIDTVKINVLPSAVPNAVAINGTLCVSGTSVVKLNPAINQTGTLYQWQSSNDNITFTDIGSSVLTDTLVTGTITSTKYFRAIIKNSDGVTCLTSTSDTVIVNNPVVSNTTPATRCGYGTVTLGASTSSGNTLNWYEAATGGTPIATGTSYTTPPINATDTYYVEATMSGGIALLGPVSPTAHGGTVATQTIAWDVNFTVLLPTTLASIDIFPIASGQNGVMQRRQGTGTGGTLLHTVNYTTNVSGGATPQTIDFNFALTPGTYSIYTSTLPGSGINRNTSGSTYPYTSSVANITGNGYSSSYYMGLYHWKFGSSCASARVPVVAKINPAPAFEITNDKTVCNNATTALTVTTGSADFNNITWSPAANLFTNAAATTAYVAGAHATTVYYKNATAGAATITANALNTSNNCTNIDTVKIQTLPATIVATTTPGQLCVTGTSVINYSPSITQTGFTQQWGNSADNLTYTDILGAMGTSYTTPTLTNTTYYKVTIKNSDGAICLSSYDTVKVSNPSITNSTSAERCGPGSLTLTASVTDGVANWYSVASGGTPLATGNSFTTPSLTATTNYWVEAAATGSGGAGTTGIIGNGTSLTGTTEELTAFCNRRPSYKMQMIFTQAELNSMGFYIGEIKGIGFDITTIGDAATNAAYTVKIGSTTQNTFTAYINSGLNTVFGPVTYTHAVGNNMVNFTSPFVWDGSSNVVIEITHNGLDDLYNAQTYYTTTSSSMTGYSYGTATTATTSTKRLNTTFIYTNQCASPRVQVTATVKPKPTADITPNGTVSLCDGESEVLTTTGIGIYSWIRNNTLISGQTSNTLTVSDADPYRVIVTGSNGCADTSAIVNVVVAPSPIVNLGNDTSICGNTTYILNAGNAGATYLWDDNTTAATKLVNNSGDHIVKVTNSFNCSATDTINVAYYPFPIVDLGDDTTICKAQPLVLDAANPGASYLWNNGAQSQTISVNQAGNYSVAVTNSDNCVGTDEIVIQLIIDVTNMGYNFTPLFNIEAGRVQFTPIYTEQGYSYSWDFGDGNTSTNEAPQHVYANTGTYTVSLTVSDGCSDSTETLNIYVDRFTSVRKVDANDIKLNIYPNPTNSNLNIEILSSDVSIEKIKVFNVLGQQVDIVAPVRKVAKQEINVNHLTSGNYIIKIETDKGIITRKFEVIK